jgi:regulator of sigma E protease
MLALLFKTASWVLPFLFVMMPIVTIHELGHFWAARSFNVAIDRFSIGFGRALFSWRDKAGVEWRIGWIPFGGYVQFAGDDNAASIPDETSLEVLREEIIAKQGQGAITNYLAFKPLWQRAIVAAAGPVANFILAVVLMAGLLMTVGEIAPPARIANVDPGSAAAAAGFKPGDLVVGAANHRVDSFNDLSRVVQTRANVPMAFTIVRGGVRMHLTATPKPTLEKDILGRDENVGILGVRPLVTAQDLTAHRYNPIDAIGVGALRTWQIADTTIYYLGRLVRGQVSMDQIGGPLRTAQLSHVIVKMGAESGHTVGGSSLGILIAALEFMVFISVNLGIFNLLPIPVLDGGHLLFYAYEAVARRPLSAGVQAAGYRVGLALLLGLMLFATTNDLLHRSIFHFLGGPFS